MKQCKKCGEVKNLDDFSPSKQNKSGLQSYCKNCNKILKDEYKKSKGGVAKYIYDMQTSHSKERGHSRQEYTKQEFVSWCCKNEAFNETYNIWVESGYCKNLKPSADRLDNNKGYSFDNIEIVTWIENSNRYHKNVRDGVANRNTKEVSQYTLSGEYIATYMSRSIAMRATGVDSGSIAKNINGKLKSAGGFTWKDGGK